MTNVKARNKKNTIRSKGALFVSLVIVIVIGMMGCVGNQDSSNDKSSQTTAASKQQESATGNVYDSKGVLLDDNSSFMKSIGKDSAIEKVKRGNDVVLTIDSELQKSIDQIIVDELKQNKQQPNTDLSDRAYVVLTEPKTGAILSMSGQQYVKDEKTGEVTFQDIAKENITASYQMGSTVTGATLLAGYEAGVIPPGHVFLDAPLKIKGTPPKQSWKNMGLIDDLTAIKQASNVYMYNVAIQLGEGKYRENQSLQLKEQGFELFRHASSLLGLGVKTGIDISGEKTGFQGEDKASGKLLDLAIGQYDAYTPMQLAQYVSTIANGGQRMQPYIVKETREITDNQSKLGAVKKETAPVILNKVENGGEYIKRIQTGFEKVMQEEGGTGYSSFGTSSYKIAGKTGAAQVFYNGPLLNDQQEQIPTYNQTLVAYAPANQPEVAIAVVVPWSYEGESGMSINTNIARKVMDVYFQHVENTK